MAPSLDLRTVADELLVRSPGAVAIVDPGGSWTYDELRAHILSIAAGLRAAGVGPGEQVALVAPPGRFALATIFGALRIGATVTPMNPRFSAGELGELAGLPGVRPAVVVTDDDHAPTAGSVASHVLGEALLDVGGGDDSAATGTVADAALLFTSGTTGRPKPVPVPWPTLTARLAAYVDPPARQTRMLCVPIHHVGGFLGALVTLLGDHSMVVQPRFDAGEWLRLMEVHRVESTFVVPTMLARVLDHPALPSTDLSSLTTVTYGASPMPDDLLARVAEALPGVGLVNTFGQTETLGGVTLSTPADAVHPVHRKSVGRLVPGVTIRIVSPGTDDKVADGDVGELLVHSPQNVVDGWLRTGDLVRVDADGYVYPEGRLSDTINRAGEKFGPVEVEAALRTHPLVHDCAVAGVPDAEVNERVGAVVVTKGSVTTEELRQWCAERIARYKAPELVVFADEVPLTDLGKVDRKAVVAMVRER